MEKIILSYDYNNELSLVLYTANKMQSMKGKLYGSKLKKGVRALTKEPIKDIYKSDENVLAVVYKDGVVYIKDYNVILNDKILREYNESIKNYLSKDNIKRHKASIHGKHVKRTSSVGKAIVVGSLATCLLIGGAALANNTLSKEDIVDIPKEAIEEVYDEEIVPEETMAPVTLEETVVTEVTPEPVVEEKQLFTASSGEAIKAEPNYIYMNFEDRSTDSKAQTTYANYNDVLTKEASIYGIDPNLMLAIATLERGTHSNEIDAGGGVGLMQVQYSVWVNHDITAFNFETNSYETFSINDQNIRDLETNVKIACMIYQSSLKTMNYNIPASLQAYNWGEFGAKSIIKGYAMECGKTFNDVINDYGDTNWINKFGEYKYANLVLSYVKPDTPLTNYKVNEDGTTERIDYQIVNQNVKNLTY